MELDHAARFALETVQHASRVAAFLQKEGAGRAVSKQDRSPVTLADYACQAIVGRALSDRFSHDHLIAEEHSLEFLQAGDQPLRDRLLDIVHQHIARDASLEAVCSWIDGGLRGETTRRWVLDPIDGTKGFLRGGQYAIALALLVDGKIAMGVLGCPNLSSNGQPGGSLYLGVAGKGAVSFDMNDLTRSYPLATSQESDPERLCFVESVESDHTDHGFHGRLIKRLGTAQPTVRLDSQAKYAIVARGEASAYLRMPSSAVPGFEQRIWDHAAGTLLVIEAGGQVTDIHGAPLDFSQGRTLSRNHGVIASNGHCHRCLIDTLKELL